MISNLIKHATQTFKIPSFILLRGKSFGVKWRSEYGGKQRLYQVISLKYASATQNLYLICKISSAKKALLKVAHDAHKSFNMPHIIKYK